MVERKGSSSNASQRLPIIFLGLIIGLIPLIVYLNLVHYESVVQQIHGRQNSPNFFTYVRALWLYLLSGTAFILFFVSQKPVESWVYRPLGLFIFFSVASTVFSQYPKMALMGEVDRNEGLLAQLSYMVIVFLAVNLVKSKRELRIILGCLLASSGLLAFIGAAQFFGYDYLYGGFADQYLIPDHFRKIAPSFKVSTIAAKPDSIFLTFGNGNYTGSYMSMLFSLSLGLIVGLKHKINFFLVPLNLLLFVNLVGSKSRAGMLGGLIAFSVVFFLFRTRLKEKMRLLVFLIVSYLILIFAMDAYSLQQNERFIATSFNRSAIGKSKLFGNFENLKIEKDRASVVFDGLELKIHYNDARIEFYDAKDQLIPHRLIQKSDLKKEDRVIFATDETDVRQSFPEVTLTSELPVSTTSVTYKRAFTSKKPSSEEEKYLVLFPEDKMRGYVIFAWPEKNVLQIGRGGITFFLAYTEKGFQILDQLGRADDIEEIEAWGFEGYENFGSSRGYIWSRTLPMLKKTWLIGYGPDTFMVYFPHNDYLGKLKHVSKGIQRIIDKPHNFFLQVAVQTGLISLLAILYLIGKVLWKILVFARESAGTYSFEVVAVKSIFLGIISYLVASMFNDSIVSIAPVFWCLLGIGIAVSNKQFQKENEDF